MLIMKDKCKVKNNTKSDTKAGRNNMILLIKGVTELIVNYYPKYLNYKYNMYEKTSINCNVII